MVGILVIAEERTLRTSTFGLATAGELSRAFALAADLAVDVRVGCADFNVPASIDARSSHGGRGGGQECAETS